MGPSFNHHSGRAVGKGEEVKPLPVPLLPMFNAAEQGEQDAAILDGAAHLEVESQTQSDYSMDSVEIYRCGSVLGVRGSTWCMNPKLTKDDFASEFAKSYYQAARDYGSAPPSAAQPLVHDSMLAERRVNQGRICPVVYKDRRNSDQFSFAPWFRGEGFEYFIHFDMAKSRDAAGVAMSHYDHHMDKVVVDLMLSIRPPDGGELRLEKFRQIVYELTNLGFCIGQVSVDSWQSVEFQQELTLKKYNVKQYSVDRTTEAYDTLVELMLSGRIDYYYEPVFITEFQGLSLIEGKKVDHPEGGSKDLSDAVAASCVFALGLSKIRKPELPGVIKMGIGGGASANNIPGAGMPYVAGITAESLGNKAPVKGRLFAI